MFARIAVVCLCCFGWTAAQEKQGPPPQREPTARELARRAAREIKEIAKEGEVDEILAKLGEQGLIDDTDVVRALGALVDDERDRVRWAAVITLRYNPNVKAGSELMSAARDKKIVADEKLFAEVIRGIGQHGDPRALSLLAEGFGPKQETDAVTDARIDAVGRIRNAEAVDTLIKFARSGFAKGHESRLATALQGQTGENLGTELRPWVLWWNRAKLGYRGPEEAPRGSAAWSSIWAQPAAARMFDRIPGSGREPVEPVDQGGPRRGPGRGAGGPAGGGGGG